MKLEAPKVVSARKAEKEKAGLRAVIDGHEFENEIRNYYTKRGFVVTTRERSKRYGEVDLWVRKSGLGFSDRIKGIRQEIYLVECKYRSRGKVTLNDFVRFVQKVKKLREQAKRGDLGGARYGAVFWYKGELDGHVNEYLSMLSVELKGIITLKRPRQ